MSKLKDNMSEIGRVLLTAIMGGEDNMRIAGFTPNETKSKVSQTKSLDAVSKTGEVKDTIGKVLGVFSDALVPIVKSTVKNVNPAMNEYFEPVAKFIAPEATRKFKTAGKVVSALIGGMNSLIVSPESVKDIDLSDPDWLKSVTGKVLASKIKEKGGNKDA